MLLLRRLLFSLALPLSTFCLAAPDTPQDLGQNLAYLRVHEFQAASATVASALAGDRPLVLDLRYATGSTRENAADLSAALAKRSASGPLFALVGPATPPPIAEALAAHPTKILRIGLGESAPSPQVVVAQPADADRMAYDAADHGTTLASLISGKVEKERYDEAALVKDFANGNLDPEPPASDPAGKSKTTATEAPPRPPTDRVLQRAVNLHRALLALGRLPKAA